MTTFFKKNRSTPFKKKSLHPPGRRAGARRAAADGDGRPIHLPGSGA